MATALINLVSILFVLPIVFKTNMPFSVEYLFGVSVFVLFGAFQGLVGYYMTRG